MYKVIKVLNNNSVLVSKDNEEVIILAKGIGFGKKSDEFFEAPKDTKKYIIESLNKEDRRPREIIHNIQPIFIEIASEILRYAQEKFDDVDIDILLALADHIAFSIKRLNEGISISNPFTNDLQLLFPDEFEVAMKGKDYIYHTLGIMISDDEVGYITLHVHSAISTDQVSTSIEATQIIHNSINQLKKDLRIEIDCTSISYIRLMNHIKFLFLRINTEEKLQMDISDFTKERFPFAYDQAKNICIKLSSVLHKHIPESEIAYLALHLERILSISIKS